MPRPFLAAAAGLLGLVAVAPAAAHVVASPSFIASEGSASIMVNAPNERDDPMTDFALAVSEGLVIAHAHDVAGWEESTDGSTATWSGGSLAPDEELAFGVDLRADRDPGVVQLQAEQGYADGAVVRWPVTLTITPAKDSPSQGLALAGAVGLVAVLAVVGIVLLARRRGRPPVTPGS